jgi:hypothetical protein
MENRERKGKLLKGTSDILDTAQNENKSMNVIRSEKVN